MTRRLVSELEGAELDAAVALAEGFRPYNFRKSHCLIVDQDDDVVTYEPSSDWEDGGPIIERERIAIFRPRHDPDWHAGYDICAIDESGGGGHWHPRMDMNHEMKGPTPLVAAMRTFVASRFGDSVDIP